MHEKYCEIVPNNCKGHFKRWQELDESGSGKIVFPGSFSREIPQEVCTSVNIVDVVDVADHLGGNDGDPQPLRSPACGGRREL